MLLLGAMVLWFTHEMVWGGKVPFYRDLGPLYYPMRFSLAQSLRIIVFPDPEPHCLFSYLDRSSYDAFNEPT